MVDKISYIAGELLGEEALNVVLYLKNKQHVSEFKVAKDFKMDIHAARAILYKLYENNLVTFERRKDPDRGWYITYWDFNPQSIDALYKKLNKAKLEKLKQRLSKEQNNEFYMCRNACTRMDFYKAMDFNFRCPECGQLMNPMDNKRTIEFINEQIQDIEKAMG